MSSVGLNFGTYLSFAASGTAATIIGAGIAALGIGAGAALLARSVRDNAQATKCIQAICGVLKSAWGVVARLNNGSLKIEVVTRDAKATHKLFNDWHSGEVLEKLNQGLQDAFAEGNDEVPIIDSLLLEKMETDFEMTETKYKQQEMLAEKRMNKLIAGMTVQYNKETELLRKSSEMNLAGSVEKMLQHIEIDREINSSSKDKSKSSSDRASRAFDDSNDDIIKQKEQTDEFTTFEDQPEIIKTLRYVFQQITDSVCRMEKDLMKCLPNYIQDLEIILTSAPTAASDLQKAKTCLENCSKIVPLFCAWALLLLNKGVTIAGERIEPQITNYISIVHDIKKK